MERAWSRARALGEGTKSAWIGTFPSAVAPIAGWEPSALAASPFGTLPPQCRDRCLN